VPIITPEIALKFLIDFGENLDVVLRSKTLVHPAPAKEVIAPINVMPAMSMGVGVKFALSALFILDAPEKIKNNRNKFLYCMISLYKNIK
jgi:hypothetical protein